MAVGLCADDSTHTINSNLVQGGIEGWKHNLDLNFRRQRRIFGSQHKQAAHADVGTAAYFVMLLSLSPLEKRGYG